MHAPRKRFGQNFLHDPATIGRIVAALDPRPGEHLVEIGPGRGALTAPVLARTQALTAIELDRDLAVDLTERFQDDGLHLIGADALRFDFSTLATAGQRLRVFGNLPYNISSPLLFHLLTYRQAIADMLFMLQREVVDRIVASPGDADYGRLSVMIQYACAAEALFVVSPGAFFPPPKVHSRMLQLTPYVTLPHPATDERRLSDLVQRAFAQRRKTLRNSVGTLVTAAQFAAAGIDPGLRPERLSVADFVRLANS
ncbi:MAG TPA: 16S rRNA (adenine(1518)-N(6)/adenine(1519)-N(6))-dimethyltransferase [Gammaproteobacteria bacterium]|uniref:16S rRNA (adenine(1518)-N(6)/adenine(1519)-N(6))- dimethyltransferase RsmA n=1 Tax=Immundisolibacter sp. TaxID=1934948 RepID=UPI000E9727DC|nr:16S rRNA (adenine(1518)-N(6)/adenine(1519)-N(6))-dimethyltransferase [Gammaproteobacteria bacterium]HCZ47389.1 16S rRNA (adenine(1518)-N(6)/adenine(1519)-N(6))-dimethyltransferase [Gammaproteobacteria bacterium]MCH76827.1 16S rRNA (adenine(1518)-N(6)/adenine(1519)-N(6))-dimethyltransferase [Gammaproteobacteria bacterium]